MIRYGQFPNSPDCYYVNYLEINSRIERSLHVNISEIRRFFGHHPGEHLLYSPQELIEFFTYRLDLEGQSGEYGKKKAKSQARMNSKRSRVKPNSPGEQEQ